MNFIVLAVVAGLALAWMWGRSEVLRRGGWRVGAGLFAVVLVVVGTVLTLRDLWEVGLPMVGFALLTAAGARLNRKRQGEGPGPFRRQAATPAQGSMSEGEARSILGVGPDADTAEIRAAYTRLMQRAHPDKGGTAGLAAQLNAARDRLLKR